MQVDVNMVDNQRNVLIKILAISPISTNRRTTSSFAIYLGNKLCHHLVFSCMYLSATRKNNHHILLYCFKYVCILCNIYNINLHPRPSYCISITCSPICFKQKPFHPYLLSKFLHSFMYVCMYITLFVNHINLHPHTVSLVYVLLYLFKYQPFYPYLPSNISPQFYVCMYIYYASHQPINHTY